MQKVALYLLGKGTYHFSFSVFSYFLNTPHKSEVQVKTKITIILYINIFIYNIIVKFTYATRLKYMRPKNN